MIRSTSRVAVLGLVASAVMTVASGAAMAGAPVIPVGSFYEPFETGLPSGSLPNHAAPGAPISLISGEWHALNVSTPTGSTGVFEQGGPGAPFDAHDGQFYAAMNFNSTSGAGNIDTFLMSPTLTFNAGDTIEFWTRTISNPSFADRLHVVYSLQGSSVNALDFADANRVLTVNPNLTLAGYPGAWTKYTVNVDFVTLPTEGRFAFNYEVTDGGPSGSNSDFIGIDSVTYTAIPEPAALGALAPAALLLTRRRR